MKCLLFSLEDWGGKIARYAYAGGSLRIHVTHSAPWDVKRTRGRFGTVSRHNGNNIVYPWIRNTKVALNISGTRNSRPSGIEHLRFSPALYIFITGSIKSPAGVAHCTFSWHKCGLPIDEQKTNNTGKRKDLTSQTGATSEKSIILFQLTARGMLLTFFSWLQSSNIPVWFGCDSSLREPLLRGSTIQGLFIHSRTVHSYVPYPFLSCSL